MSGRTRASQHMNVGQCVAIDRRIDAPWHGGGQGRNLAAARPWEDGLLWPRSRMIGAPGEALNLPCSVWFAVMPEEGGCQSMLKISGTCKDSNGDPIEGATVQVFVTSTDAYLRACTSAVDGAYEARTEMPAGTQHYLVAYKAGSPDVAGTTVNTLTGS